MSNDVASVLSIARAEKLPTEAKEIIKDPMVLEFLGLKRESSYYEKDLENAIITHLQDFILELGNGFAFVARQKRIHIEVTSILWIWYFTTACCRALLSLK
ncbi:DUF1016 domain-containing protein [Haoranjiania flava]|uniref:DUF1016 domain-containing protein n=1 Tax=Haoranjiania flava TaxID=1856322 RepID=A0AAE3IME8_9BACT|nr:DUF1016 domain-containing protein [Haoranjiania flava]MCU7694750.1 DUF1016 domain-containing protein [Haoranjiania flava]